MSHKKADDAKQGHDAPRLALVDADHPEMERLAPPPSRRWLKATRDGWAELWGHDMAAVFERVDLPALRRLFDLRDRQVRALRLYDEQPFVDGSQGQPVTNPVFAVAMALERSIAQLEAQTGLTPKARANLGIAIGQARLTAGELNRRAIEATRAQVVDVEAEDRDDDFQGWAPA